MNQMSAGEAPMPHDGAETTSAWHVEVLGRDGWALLRDRRGAISSFASYDDAVAAAVREWQRSDRPARPAPAR